MADGEDFNLFDLPADEFRGVLNELGYRDEDFNDMLRQYRDYHGLNLSAVEEGRRRGSFLPMIWPEDMTGGEALMSGNWEWAIPGMLTGAVDSAYDAVTAPYAAYQGLIPPDDMLEEAMNTAGVVGVGAVGSAGRRALEYNPTMARMFGGRATAVDEAQRSMDLADALRARGASPEEIWQETGSRFTFPSTHVPDRQGRWTPVYEFSDDAARVIPENIPTTSSMAHHIPLNEIFDNPEMAYHYPDIGDVLVNPRSLNVHPRSSAHYVPRGSAGRIFNPVDDLIEVSPRYAYDQNPTDFPGIMLHELQHAISSRDPGVPGGSNTKSMQGYYTDALDDALRRERNANALLQSEEGTTDALRRRLTGGIGGLREYLGALSSDTQGYREMLEQRYSSLPPIGYGRPSWRQGSDGMYYRTPGEVLARLSEYRQDFTPAERARVSPMRNLSAVDEIDWSNIEPPILGSMDVREAFGLNDWRFLGRNDPYEAEFYAYESPQYVDKALADLRDDLLERERILATNIGAPVRTRTEMIEDARQRMLDEILPIMVPGYSRTP